MKTFILLLVFTLAFSVSGHSWELGWKIQDFTSDINLIGFSIDGDTLVIESGNYLVFIDNATGTEIKRREISNFFKLSNDFKYGLRRSNDTLEVFNTFNDSLEFTFEIKYKTEFSEHSYSKIVFSPDSKYLLVSTSFYDYSFQSKYGKKKGFIDIINLSNGKLLKTAIDDLSDSLGEIENLFFDKKDKNSLYFSSCYLNVDDSNDIIINQIFQYDFQKDTIKSIYSEHFKYSDENKPRRWYEPIEIYATNPFGCAMIESGSFQRQMSIIYPLEIEANYTFEEGLDFNAEAMIDFAAFIIIYRRYSNENLYLSEFRGEQVQQFPIFYFYKDNAESIDEFEGKDYTKIWINPSRKSFAVFLSEREELLMYFDSIQTDIHQTNKKYHTQIYPNPATDYIEINLLNVILNEVKDPVIKIFDLLGNVVLSEFKTHPLTPSQEGEMMRIDISSLSPGVYFVKVGEQVNKFVKM